MADDNTGAWRPISISALGLQPHLAREWRCLPAWDVTAIHRGPDAEVPRPGAPDQKKYAFYDRHLDRRFSIPYPHATRESPRFTGRAIGDALREWDALVETRDGYLEDAGLTPESPAADVARCLADTFKCDSYFKDKPMCDAFESDPRALDGPVEGLLYKSYCVGCAKAYVAMVDSLGLPARNIGCGAHWVAEVLVDGRWHLVDSVGRHDRYLGLAAYYESSFVETYLDPTGDHGEGLTDEYRDGLWKRPNPQFHFTGGTWAGPLTLRYGTSNAYALYPDASRRGIKSGDGKRLPMIARANGFYWPRVHTSDGPAARELRERTAPVPLAEGDLARDYLYHELAPGQAVRQTVYVGATGDLEEIELVLTFALPDDAESNAALWRGLELTVNGERVALPPLDASHGVVRVTVALARSLWRAESVNTLVLANGSAVATHVPCVPAVMEPYVPPLRG